MKKEYEATKLEEKKTRKTLDQYLGINGLCIFAIIGAILNGGIIGPIGVASGVSAIYYLIKLRKDLKTNQKLMGWVLIAVWIYIFSLSNK